MVSQRARIEAWEVARCPMGQSHSRRGCCATLPRPNLHEPIPPKSMAAISLKQSRKTGLCTPLEGLQKVAFPPEMTSSRPDRCANARSVGYPSFQHWFFSSLERSIVGSQWWMQMIPRRGMACVWLSGPRVWAGEMCCVYWSSRTTRPQVQQIQYFPDVS